LTVIEMLVATILAAIVMGAVLDVVISGMRAGADSSARLTAQQNTRLALDRLEFEGRCATTASVLNSGAGVAFSLPTTCSHTNGETSVSWCVASGTLTRYASSSCTGTGQDFVDAVTTADPFSIPATPSGDLPSLDVNITVDASSDSGTTATLADTITLRNSPRAA
jgi:Tfp pilus assembly protein PilW